jgi:hypothetical protein
VQTRTFHLLHKSDHTHFNSLLIKQPVAISNPLPNTENNTSPSNGCAVSAPGEAWLVLQVKDLP